MRESKELNEFTQAYSVRAILLIVYFTGWFLCAAVIYLLQNKESSFASRAIIAAIIPTLILGIVLLLKRRFLF